MKPLTPSTPHVIIMVGIPGAGKSHFAEHFAKTFSAPYVNHGRISDIIAADEAAVTQLSSHLLDELLKTQRTLIYEGPTHAKSVRQALVKKITNAGYKPLIVWVQTEPLEAKRRVAKQAKHTPQSFDGLVKRFQAPTATERPIVISGKHTYASQVKMVLKHLAGGSRPEPETSTKQRVPGRHIAVR